MILHCGDIGIRSPLAKVKVLLSSKTLFKFSIQMASTGPSSTIQIFSPGKIVEKKYKIVNDLVHYLTMMYHKHKTLRYYRLYEEIEAESLNYRVF
jgi:hypothetical protein